MLSEWFEWLSGGTELSSLSQMVVQQLTKVLYVVEQFILFKRGDDFMKDLDDVRDIAKRVNGNILLYQIFLLRDLAKLFKNQSEKVIFMDGYSDKKSGPGKQHPNIFLKIYLMSTLLN